jgi:uncharacterized membrane protein
MHTFSAVQALGITLWLALCAGLAVWLIRRNRPLRREQVLALVGAGLLALAPCTYLALRLLPGVPSLLPSGVQLAGAALAFAAAWLAYRRRLHPDAESGTWTYPQKSAAVVLLALLALAFSYFGSVWQQPGEAALGRFIHAIILLTILMIVGHIVIAVLHGAADELNVPRDERDRRVDLHSMRNAYFVLAGGFWVVPVMLLVDLPQATALNVWFGLLVAAEIVYYSSVITYYRFGTD